MKLTSLRLAVPGTGLPSGIWTPSIPFESQKYTMGHSFTMTRRFIVGQTSVSLILWLKTTEVECDTLGVADEGSGRKLYKWSVRPWQKNISPPSLLKPRWSTSDGPVSRTVASDLTGMSDSHRRVIGPPSRTHNEPCHLSLTHSVRQARHSRTLLQRISAASSRTRGRERRRHNRQAPDAGHWETTPHA